jgi:F-type H+-transporting ATPase subunit b
MLIDWFTVAAQIVNFTILVWLLQRFLYKPIVQAVKAREKRVAEELADAARQKAEVERAGAQLASKDKAFDDHRAALLAAAVAAATHEHDRLMEQSRIEVETLRVKQRDLLRSERLAQGDRLSRLVSGEVFAIARRALKDLAGADLEERMAAIVVGRLRDMTPIAKDSWNAALRGGHVGAVVRSRFELAEPSRALLQAALDGGHTQLPLRFETAGDEICGIELIAPGQKLSWTIVDYLKSLEGKVDALLKGAS